MVHYVHFFALDFIKLIGGFCRYDTFFDPAYMAGDSSIAVAG